VEAQQEHKMDLEEKLLVHILDTTGEVPETSMQPSRKNSVEMMTASQQDPVSVRKYPKQLKHETYI